jgi:ligand-binding SRPBCC domain-containing protein
MPIITAETLIHAPLELCFDLARDTEIHCLTTANTEERIVDGKSVGLLELGDVITFEAVHLGVRQKLTVRITEYQRPNRFVDQMVKGIFKSLRHVHEFEAREDGTLMRDTLEWKSPLGILGTLADALMVRRHMQKFLIDRNRELKRIVEASRLDPRTLT